MTTTLTFLPAETATPVAWLALWLLWAVLTLRMSR
jgi:hypothetical protein